MKGDLPFEYQEAVRRLRTWIDEHRLGQGARLPSERELAKSFGLARSTVNKAIIYLSGSGELRHEGYKLIVSRARTLTESLPPIHILAFAPDPTAAEVAARYGTETIELEWGNTWARRKRLTELMESGCQGLLLSLHNDGPPVGDLLFELEQRQIPTVVRDWDWGFCSVVAIDLGSAIEQLVELLVSLGHQGIALILNRYNVEGANSRWHAILRQACWLHSLSEDQFTVITLKSEMPEEHRARVRQLLLDRPDITGIICNGEMSGMRTILTAREAGRQVPDGLSVTAVGPITSPTILDIGLTTVGTSPMHGSRLAAELLFSHLLQLKRTRQMPERERIFLAARLTVRRSVGPAPGTAPPPLPNPAERAEKVRQAARDWVAETANNWEARPYTRAIEAAHERLVPVDLAPFANRAVRRTKAWLGGEPLMRFPPGLKTIHGVPFRVLDERLCRGMGAIALRSKRVRMSAAEPLPSEVVIPIDRHVEAAYFLHGCGWVSFHQPFAEYVLEDDTGPIASVALLPYAFGPETQKEEEAAEWAARSNIQDWWPARRQIENEHARHLTIGTSREDERFLYTLELVNPHPERRVARLRLRSDPQQATTVVVLSITLLS